MTYIDPIVSHGNDDNLSQPQGDGELSQPQGDGELSQPQGDVELSHSQGDLEILEPANQAVVYLPSQPTEEEQNQIVSVTQNGVSLTSSAVPGAIGPVLGNIDVCESEESEDTWESWEDEELSQDSEPLGDEFLLVPASSQGDVLPLEPAMPAMMYSPNPLTEEQQDKLLSIMPDGVFLTGVAAFLADGQGPGKVDICERKNTYVFRVVLPDVARDAFTCDVAPDGLISIKGVAKEKVLYKYSMESEMESQNPHPTSPFIISFKLPGPIDSEVLSGHVGIDGIFEGIVKKKIPSA